MTDDERRLLLAVTATLRRQLWAMTGGEGTAAALGMLANKVEPGFTKLPLVEAFGPEVAAADKAAREKLPPKRWWQLT